MRLYWKLMNDTHFQQSKPATQICDLLIFNQFLNFDWANIRDRQRSITKLRRHLLHNADLLSCS